jgi:hypothetical protein
MAQEDFFKREMTPEILSVLRTACRQLPDMSHEARAKLLQPKFSQFKIATLEDYSRGCLNATEKTFSMHLEGKISIMALMELCAIEPKEQDFLCDEYVARGMTPVQLRRTKRLRKEGHGIAVAIAKAMGEVPLNDPSKETAKKSIDAYLDEIGKMGSRWRATVSMVFDLLGDEEQSAGIHQGLMEKTYVLRHLINEQNNYINQRFNRYLNLLKKKMRAEPEPAERIKEAEATVIDVIDKVIE